MSNCIPVWYMRNSRSIPSPASPEPEAGAPEPASPDPLSALGTRLRQADPETLLLLALLWILWQEGAGHKLLLALAYIII